MELIRGQIREICPRGSDTYLPFVGTLFLFIAVSNVLDIVPGWHPPTGSLSTTAALAISVGVAVPVFGILRQGLAGYLRHYLRPSWIMLPFHLLSETTRNLALAVRLFGNIMSGTMIAGILLGYRAAICSSADAGFGAADWFDSSLHFCGVSDGLYRRRGTTRAGRSVMMQIRFRRLLWIA